MESKDIFLTSENLGKLEAAFNHNGDFDKDIAEKIVIEILTEQNQMFQ
jgi:hypothetical protein